MRWLRRLLWHPYAAACRTVPLVAFKIMATEVAPGVDLIVASNWVARLLSRLGGYPYSVMYVVDDEVLIDSGFPWARRAFHAYLIESGLSESIHSLITTHEHEDHYGNNDMVARLTGATIYAHPRALAEISYPFRENWYRSFLFGPVHATAASPAPATISTKERTLQIIHAPGHTPGHVVVYDRSAGVLFAGDLFLDAELDVQLADADGPSWLASLDEIAKLNITHLLDGHGVVRTGEDAALALKQKAAFLRTMRSAIWAEIAEGPRSVQQITDQIAGSGAVSVFSQGEGWLSILTANDFSRSNLVRTFVRELAASTPPDSPNC